MHSCLLLLIWTFQHHNTQPVLIFSRVRIIHLERLEEGTWFHSFDLISTKMRRLHNYYVRNNFNPLCRRNAALIDWVDAITIFSMYCDIHTISDFNIIIYLLVFMFFAQERFWNEKLISCRVFTTNIIHTFNNYFQEFSIP